MVRRSLLAMGIGVLVAGGVTFAQGQGQGPVKKWVIPPENLGVAPVATCFAGTPDEFIILNDFTVGYQITDRSDRAGTLVEQTWHAKVVLDVYFNSTDDNKRAEAVPGEHQVAHYDFTTGLMRSTAMYSHVTVPGYGRILAQHGIVYDFVHHKILLTHGPNDVFGGNYDWTPFCEALK